MASNITRTQASILDFLIEETRDLADEDIMEATSDLEGDPEAIAEDVRGRFASTMQEAERHDDLASSTNRANGGGQIFAQDSNLTGSLGSVGGADNSEDWVSIPFALAKPIDLAFGRPVLSTEGNAGELKIGRRISLAGTIGGGLVECGWKDIELRLIFSLNADGQISDVSVSARASNLGAEAFTLRLRDSMGSERMLSLSRACMQGYAMGAPLLANVDELELLCRVQHFPET
jgi:hypothetical protein